MIVLVSLICIVSGLFAILFNSHCYAAHFAVVSVFFFAITKQDAYS